MVRAAFFQPSHPFPLSLCGRCASPHGGPSLGSCLLIFRAISGSATFVISPNYFSSQRLLSSQNPSWFRLYRPMPHTTHCSFHFFCLNSLRHLPGSGGRDSASPCTLASACLPLWKPSWSHRLSATLPSGLPKHPFSLWLEFPSSVLSWLISFCVLLTRQNSSWVS